MCSAYFGVFSTSFLCSLKLNVVLFCSCPIQLFARLGARNLGTLGIGVFMEDEVSPSSLVELCGEDGTGMSLSLFFEPECSALLCPIDLYSCLQLFC